MAYTSKEQLDLNLSPIELGLLQEFAGNVVLLEAVKKAILAPIYYQGTLQAGKKTHSTHNFLMSFVPPTGQRSNEEVGADLKSALEGCRMVETGFDLIDKYKVKATTAKEKGNVGR